LIHGINLMRGNTMCLCGDKRGYDPEMTKYAVDTLTEYSILPWH
jgi:hypothetical protein